MNHTKYSFLKAPRDMYDWILTRLCQTCTSECGELEFRLQNGGHFVQTSVFYLFRRVVSMLSLSHFFIFLAATKMLYEWFSPSVCPSVRLCVRLSVCPSHLFDYVSIIVSSWNFEELLPMTRLRSMQQVKVRGQRSRSHRSQSNLPFPDSNSSLNSHMMIKLCI